jgi:uncharacterized protein YejL (UPF0352 family)
MRDKVGSDRTTFSDAQLTALLRATLEVIEAHGESNDLNVLLRDFATELLRRRVVARVEFIRLIDQHRPD